MPTPSKKITQRVVEALKPGEEIRDSELPGFRVKRTPKGKIGYFVQSSVRGGRSSVTVNIHEPTAECARNQAKSVLLSMRQGIDLTREKKKQKAQEELDRLNKEAEEKAKNVTLGHVFENYVRQRELKESTRQGYQSVFSRCLRDWADLPIASITEEILLDRFEELSDHPAQANQVMRVLKAVYNDARLIYRDHEGKRLIVENPLDCLKGKWNRIKRRETYIQDHELNKWFSAVMSLENKLARDYLLLVIFTGLRKNEAAALKRAKVDFNSKTLTVEDPKNHITHTLPMVPFIAELLKARIEESRKTHPFSQFVFPADSESGYVQDLRKQMDKVIAQSEVDFSLHDLRRTFTTTAEGLDSVSFLDVKKLVNHKLSDVTAGYVMSNPERLRPAMTAVTERLLELMTMKNESEATG